MSGKSKGAGGGKRRAGRPKGARNVKTIVKELARQRIPIHEAGEDQQVSVVEALVLKLQHLAMTGDVAANKRLDQLRLRIEPEPPADAGLLVVPQPLAQTEWIRRAEIEDRSRQKPEMPQAAAKGQADSTGPVDQPVKQAGGKRSPSQFVSRPNMRGRLFR